MMGMLADPKKSAVQILDNSTESVGVAPEKRGDYQYFRHEEMKDDSIGDMGVNRAAEDAFNHVRNNDMEGFKKSLRSMISMMLSGPEIVRNPGDSEF